MQFGHGPGPGASLGLFLFLFLPPVPGDPARRGSAAPQGQCPGQRHRLRVLGDPVQPGWGGDIPPQGPQSPRPTRFSLQPAKSWDEEDPTGVGTRPRTRSARVCPLRRSTHPSPELPPRLFGKGTAWKGTNPKDTIVFPAINGSVIHLGSGIVKAGMLSSWIHRISATPSPLSPTGFITLQLPSFIPFSLCSRLELCGAASSALGRISSSRCAEIFR